MPMYEPRIVPKTNIFRKRERRIKRKKIDAFSITIWIYLADESVNIIGYYKKKVGARRVCFLFLFLAERKITFCVKFFLLLFLFVRYKNNFVVIREKKLTRLLLNSRKRIHPFFFFSKNTFFFFS